MEEKRKNEGWDVSYIFMDTGAEHPKTYEFIRNVVKHFEIDLVCLKVKVNPELGKGTSYRIVDIDGIGKDLKPWEDITEKYSTPYMPSGAFCSYMMKTVPYQKYCDDHFGKDEYLSWLGMRIDEPKRIKPKKGKRYLAEISDFEKDDILSWWKTRSFDLDLDEHKGNCVFCIKKGVNKVALAAKDEPEMAVDFLKMIDSKKIRIIEKRELPIDLMYRGQMSLKQIINTYADMDRGELFKTLRYSSRFESGSCSESCEVFNDDFQLDLFKEL